MEKLRFKPYDKEHMRTAMLRHEATFKEQVYELHRLYQIQKILMKNICGSTSQRCTNNKVDGYSGQRPISTVDYDEIINKINVGEESEDIDERDIELTLGPTSFSQRRRGAKKLDGSNNSDNCSSSSGSSSHLMNRNKIIKANNNNSKKVGNVEEELRMKQHPPWLFQVLSLT